MKDFILKIQKKRLVVAALTIIIGVILGNLIEHTQVMNINAILKWSLGLGAVTILSLHCKSFFSTGDLGRFYTRFYGAGFGLIYTSIVFLLFTSFYAGQNNGGFNIVAYTTIISTALYNFIVNNYSGVEKEHLIARKMLEKKMEEDSKKRLGSEDQQGNKKNKASKQG